MEPSRLLKKLFYLFRIFVVATLFFSQLGLAAKPTGANPPCQVSIEVGNTDDSGPGSLRQALVDVCTGGTITFNSSLSGSTILLLTTLTIAQNVTIDGSALVGKVNITTDNMGRVVMVNSGVTATLNSLKITHGNTSGSGSGIYSYGTLTVSNSLLFNNLSSSNGAGIYNDAGTLTVTNSTLSENGTTGSGGGIYNMSGTVTLTDSTLSTNSAQYGGGMYNNGTATITNSTFSENHAQYGGGMYNNSTATITNSTFSANTADDTGGGIINNTANTITITNSTLSANSSILGGGILSDGTATLRNTIVANSPSGGNCFGSITDGGGNLVWGNSTNCPAITSADPKLGPLADNGGATQTFALLPGSAAIDAGNDATCAAAPVSSKDQRSMLRPQGAHCDIGAYEFLQLCFVDVDAIAGNNTGFTWKDAFTDLQSALGIPSCSEIWVAAGTYKPTSTADRTISFSLIPGGAVYGGFAGTETARNQRNPVSNPTILSGDIDNNDTQTPIITDLTTVGGNTSNSYHVVIGTNGSTLDGFTITAGYANGPDLHILGGGMLTQSTPTLTNLTFRGNSAESGGGLAIWYGGPATVTNITFIGNKATSYGGGIYAIQSIPILTNITFSSNMSSNAGGGIFLHTCNPTLNNLTFKGNSAMRGGGLYNHNSSPTINNSIFWSNTASILGPQIFDFNTSTPSVNDSVNDSVVEGGYGGGGGGATIITGDPLLGPLGYYGGFTQTIPLFAGSSAVDTGNNGTCAATDQRGVLRPQGAQCDIGAFEGFLYRIFLPMAMR